MGEEETNYKVESEPTQEAPDSEKSPKDTPPERSLIPAPDHMLSHSKSPPIVTEVSDSAPEKRSGDAIDIDAVLARVETEKKLALVKAWEENEKTKTDNKAYKKLSAIGAWENSKKACVEAQLKKIEENFEKKRAECEEKMSNKTAEIHREAEEKRATVEAKRGEDMLKVEEIAAKFRASGSAPKRLFGCFGC